MNSEHGFTSLYPYLSQHAKYTVINCEHVYTIQSIEEFTPHADDFFPVLSTTTLRRQPRMGASLGGATQS